MTPVRIGRYEGIERLGSGAMGEVYLAQDPILRRQVAIKVMRPQAEEGTERFLQEARAIAALSHPNIVVLHEMGVEGEQPYLVMEHLPGVSLDVWRTTPHAEREALGVLAGLCRAVQHAHAHGVLHRDLKPSNVQVLPDGTAKLMDFGIARTDANRMTATGIVLGTPEYLAPELLHGADASPRSDLYALGLLAYELLTGGNPFAAPTIASCLQKVVSQQPEPLRNLRPDLPADLGQEIDACLRKRPEERPRDTQGLLRAFEARLAAPPSAAPATLATAPTERVERSSVPLAAPAGRPRRWLRPALAAGVVLLVIGGVALSWRGRSQPGAASRAAEGEAPSSTGAIPPAGTAGTPPAGGPPIDGGRGEPGPSVSAVPSDRTSASRDQRLALSAKLRPGSSGRQADDAPLRPPGGTPTPPPISSPASGQRSSAGSPPVSSRSAAPPGSPELPSSGEVPVPSGGRTRESVSPTGGTDPAPSSTTPGSAGARGAGTPSVPSGVVPPSAVPAGPPAPRLVSLTPSSIRRGASASLELRGEGLEATLRVEVRRGRGAPQGIDAIRLRILSAGAARVTLEVAEDAPLGFYTLTLIRADGRASNALSFEVNL